jgi:hypothetical protein
MVGTVRTDHVVTILKANHMAVIACIRKEGKVRYHGPGSGGKGGPGRCRGVMGATAGVVAKVTAVRVETVAVGRVIAGIDGS